MSGVLTAIVRDTPGTAELNTVLMVSKINKEIHQMALPTLLFADQVGYSIGSLNDRVPPTKLYVTASSITSNVATLNARVLEGNIPLAGQLISTTGLTAIPNRKGVVISCVM